MDRSPAMSGVSFRITLAAIVLLLWPILAVLRSLHVESVTRIMIPAFIALLLGNVCWTYMIRPKRTYILIIVAFFFVLIGDLTVNLATQYMAISPAFFIVTHLLLTVFFIKETGLRRNDLFLGAPIAVASGVLLFFTVPDASSLLMTIGITVYLIALSLMGWRATCYLLHPEFNQGKRLMAAFGGLLFYVTDILVGIYTINHTRALITWIWIFYPPALFCLSAFEWFEKGALDRSFGEH
jgi:uncharacterized membrane protein YhhN